MGVVGRTLIPNVEVQPGTKLSTLDEVFDFVECATDEPVHFNIESKINPVQRNQTRSAAEFVNAMGAIFAARGEAFVDRITHQSFDVSPSLPSSRFFGSCFTGRFRLTEI